MRRYNHKVSISKLVCPECKNIFPIPRMINSNREKGHIKTMWCPFCKNIRDMVECRAHDTYVNVLDVLINKEMEEQS